jgi:hypothetical protein
LLGQSLILLFPLPLFSSISNVAKVDAKEAGFLQALETAKDITLDMDIDTLFHTRRKIWKRK